MGDDRSAYKGSGRDLQRHHGDEPERGGGGLTLSHRELGGGAGDCGLPSHHNSLHPSRRLAIVDSLLSNVKTRLSVMQSMLRASGVFFSLS